MNNYHEIVSILNSIDVKVIIYLHFTGGATARKMMRDALGSQEGLNRALRDLAIHRIVRADMEHGKRDKPFCLTERGKVIAELLVEADSRISKL